MLNIVNADIWIHSFTNKAICIEIFSTNVITGKFITFSLHFSIQKKKNLKNFANFKLPYMKLN